MEVCHPENQLIPTTLNEPAPRWYSAPQETGEQFGPHELTRGLREPKLVIIKFTVPSQKKKKES